MAQPESHQHLTTASQLAEHTLELLSASDERHVVACTSQQRGYVIDSRTILCSATKH